jgi:hypothetical protein
MADERPQPDNLPPSTQEERKEQENVARVLENARQLVKPIVKKEAEGEVITTELYALRLKAAHA